MFYVKQNESTAARRRVPILMVDETDGSTPETGLTLYGLVAKNGGTFAASAGTFAETGYGQYYYQFDTGEIDTLGFAGIHVTATGARNYDAIVHVTAYDAYSGSFISPSDVWSYDISGVTGAGLAGSQLNLAASGSGATSGDIATAVWDYTGATNPSTTKETLESANTNASNAASQTGASTIRDAVWDTDLSFLSGTTQAAGILYQAAAGTTLNAPAEVWSYATRTLTSGGGITAGDVWTYDVSAISTAGTAGSQLNLAALPGAGGGITAGDVWDYVLISTGNSADSTLGDAKQYALQADSQTQATNLRPAVWDFDINSGFAGTTIPYPLGYIIQSGEGITTVNSAVWNYDISAISTAGTAGSQLNLSALPSAGSGLTAGDVWDFTVIGFGSTGSAAVTLAQTLFNTGNIETYVATQTPQDIWTYSGIEGRTITGGAVTSVVDPVSVSSTSMSGIANTVWSVASRTITGGVIDTNNDKTGYSLSGTQSFNLTGNITGNLSGSVGSVTNAVDISTASMSGIANTVWNYATRTLTSGGGITAGDVWTYDISSITTAGLAGSQLNLAAIPSTGSGITAGDVWDYDIINNVPAANSAGEVLNSVKSDTNSILTQTNDIPNQVWAYDPSLGGAIPASGGYLIEAAAGTTANAPVEVWSYATRTLTSAAGATAGDVWSYADRTITGGSVTSVVNGVDLSQTAYSGVATTVWNAATRTLTTLNNVVNDIWSASTRTITDGYVSQAGTVTGNVVGSVGSVLADVSLSAATQASIANSTWNYATRTLTSAATGITAGDVWDYAGGRTITGGTITTNNDKTGYSLSGTQSFNLTGNITGNLSGSVGSVSADVSISPATQASIANSTWSYATRTLTSSTGATAGDVWSYADRTITGGSVTSVVNGVTVTTNNDKSGYALSTAGVNAVQSGLSTLTQAQVGTEVDSSLSDVGLTSTVTGRIDVAVSTRLASSSYVAPPTEASIANTVWSVASRTITGGTVDSVTNPVGVTTGSMSGIANTVWSYPTRTITSGAGATAGDIWTYNIASISASGSAGKQLNDASVSGSVVTIVNGPYKLTSIAEGTDGRIDILADSVQTIQLNCSDGFGQPFNITGYTAAVNVYDVSGALADTYVPTVDFASSGILSFDIDTTITGTTGRYTLVVELTSGAEVVQLGPLEVLVRPL